MKDKYKETKIWLRKQNKKHLIWVILMLMDTLDQMDNLDHPNA